MISAVSKTLSDLQNQNVYICFEPELLDFTDRDCKPRMLIHSQSGDCFSLDLQIESLAIILTMLKLSLFQPSKKIVVWDFKGFASYVLYHTRKPFVSDAQIIDLKVIESLCGKRKQPPKAWSNAMARLKDLVLNGVYKETEGLYKRIHVPLLTTVVPHLETVGILNTETQKKVHACYEIDGQENSRLKCSGCFKQSYVPHAMTPELKSHLRPRNEDEVFMVFDYRGNEVYVLSWISQDEALKEVCLQKDVYAGLYEKITENKFEGKKDRDFAKKIFLPVIYGQSAYSLSRKFEIEQSEAQKIVERIYKVFPAAISYVESFQTALLENGYVKDFFGKRRSNFEQGKEYVVRNFAVQSPAALICLEKLNQLYFALNGITDLAYTLHDGYAVYADKNNWKQVYKTCFKSLSAESDFCPGLKFKVTCAVGRNLNELKTLGNKE